MTSRGGGQSALDLVCVGAAAREEELHFDVCLLDICMPDLDVWEFVCVCVRARVCVTCVFVCVGVWVISCFSPPPWR